MLEIRVYNILDELAAELHYVPSRTDAGGAIPRHPVSLSYRLSPVLAHDEPEQLAEIVADLIKRGVPIAAAAGGYSVLT